MHNACYISRNCALLAYFDSFSFISCQKGSLHIILIWDGFWVRQNSTALLKMSHCCYKLETWNSWDNLFDSRLYTKGNIAENFQPPIFIFSNWLRLSISATLQGYSTKSKQRKQFKSQNFVFKSKHYENLCKLPRGIPIKMYLCKNYVEKYAHFINWA